MWMWMWMDVLPAGMGRVILPGHTRALRWFFQGISSPFIVQSLLCAEIFYSWQNRGRAQALGFFGRFCAPQEHPGDVRENIHGVARPLECPAGHYCPPGTRAANQYPCPEGTYSRQPGLANPRDCRPCPGGTFCARAGGNCVWIEQNPHLLWVWERMKGSVQFIQTLRSICSRFWEPSSPI